MRNHLPATHTLHSNRSLGVHPRPGHAFRLWACIGFAYAVLGSARPAAVEAKSEVKRAVLSLQIVKLRGKLTKQGNAPGKVGCSLYSGPDGYPTEPDKALQKSKCTVVGRSAQCRFAPLPRGTYAVACVHDENANGTLDTNWIGIPTEGTVASNHAKGMMGPPEFEDAKFPFHAEPKRLRLTMGY